MTGRSRVFDTAFAAVATIAALLPLTSLFTPPGLLWPVASVVLVIAIVGIALRTVLRSAVLVFVGQLVAAFGTLILINGRESLDLWPPGRDLFLAWNSALVEGLATIQQFSAPAPASRGVIFGLSLIAALLALCVDVTSVTRNSPAAAGLPLLTAYLVSAANASSGLHPVYFLIAAGAWLIMVAHQGTGLLRRWGPTATAATPERAASMQSFRSTMAGSGRRLGVVTLLLAVLAPLVLPNVPERYLFDGLSRGGDGGGGSVSLSNSFDIANSLADQSDDAVLTYETDSIFPGPLRVGIFDVRLGRGQQEQVWRQRPTRPGNDVFAAADPSVVDPDVETTARRITVTENSVAVPYVPVPQPISAFGASTRGWSLNSDGDISATETLDNYAADFVETTPTEAQLHAGGDTTAGTVPQDMQIDPGSRDYLRALSEQIVPAGADQIETARAILAYLNRPEFTYSLELAPQEPGRSTNPIVHFLETKRGYCIQYASAMIMLARVNGIPARMAVGFLPGTVNADGTRTVQAADAHAWPELRLGGVGWLRFEPTPASHAGIGPNWSTPPLDTPDDTSTEPTDVPSDTTSTAARPLVTAEDSAPIETPESQQPSWWQRATDLSPLGWFVVVLILAALAATGLPLLASIRRRQLLSAAQSDAERVEAQWSALMRQIDDLGLAPPPGATPRQSAAHLRTAALLDEPSTEAVNDVVRTLERARYAHAATDLPDIGDATQRVRAAVEQSQTWRHRLRARLLPSDGKAVIRAAVDRIARPARRH